MSDMRVARRYALALMGMAEEQRTLDRLAGDLQVLDQTIRSSREFSMILKSPVISKEKKRIVFAELFKKHLDAVSMDFLNLLAEKGREDVLPRIIQEFFRLNDERLGIVTLELKAATELSADQQRSVQQRFEQMTKKKIRISFTLDKALKGGFIARVGDTVYNGSVQRQLELMHKRFTSGGAKN
ncbi:MAG: ATP synthase F1 subunit delta [bacterium]